MGSLFDISASSSTSLNATDTYGFPSPWSDMASTAYPENPITMVRWAEYIASNNVTYRQAMSRVVAYFLTDIEIAGEDISDDEKDNYEDFLDNTLHVRRHLRAIGLDFLIYGNSFVSVLMKFKRSLRCPKCSRVEFPLDVIANDPKFNFIWSNFEFHATCPACKFRGSWGKPIDRRGRAEDVYVMRWNPNDIEINHDLYTDTTNIIWKIPADYRKQVTEGKLLHIMHAPWEVIQAIKHNNFFRFADNVVYHLREEPLAGLRTRGWGIPHFLTAFRQMWYCQVLHRYNEAIALDYVIPFRTITPAQRSGDSAQEPLANLNMSSFVSRVQSMLRRRRRDPAAWNVLPFPIEYKALGGDARALAPKDLLEQGLEVLLNGLGVPVELFKGTLQLQTAPAAIRLFESQWVYLPQSLNAFLDFLSDRLTELLSWEHAELRLTRPMHADDLSKITAQLQLAAGKQISQDTALRPLDLDVRKEMRKMLEEEEYQVTLQQEFQERMQDKQTQQQLSQGGAPGAPGGAAPPGGAPPAGQGGGDPSQQGQGMGAPPSPVQQAMAQMPIGPNSAITPQDLWGRAQALDSQLLALPDAQRRTELLTLKQANPTMHMAVTSMLRDMRSQAASQGRQMVMQQQFGAQ